MKHFAVLMSFLRDRSQFLEQVDKGIKLERLIFSLLISSLFFLAIYGAIMGSTNGILQVLSSAIKLPALYLLTTIICLPTLYFYDIVSGSKYNFKQYLALCLASLSIMSVMLFGLAPVTLFFRISINDYKFFALLNVIMLGISGVIGINFLYKRAIAIAEPNSDFAKHRKLVIKSWLVLFAFVGSQLGWTLRPFFGNPNEPFALFRELESNFYAHLFKLIISFFGFN